VIRNKAFEIVHIRQLVPGDVIFMKSGDKIPADAILFNVSDFKVDQSALTGESASISKRPCRGAGGQKAITQFGMGLENKLNTDDQNPLNSPSLVFKGTLAVSGLSNYL
jgi:magnesium-transporting ATPase (P-type)